MSAEFATVTIGSIVIGTFMVLPASWAGSMTAGRWLRCVIFGGLLAPSLGAFLGWCLLAAVGL